jgi:hypothetical protein
MQHLTSLNNFGMPMETLWKKSPQGSSFPSYQAVEEPITTLSHTNTILRRRGRAFKRLSILTGALHPFDPFGNMDSSSQALSEFRTSITGISDQSSVTATEKSAIQEEVVTADFAMLTSTPPPLLSDHPMHRSDPFSVVSNSPLLSTTSTLEEIRRCVSEVPKCLVSVDNTNSSGDSRNSPIRRKLFNFEGRMTPTTSKSAVFGDDIPGSITLSPKTVHRRASPHPGRTTSPYLLLVNDVAGDSKRGLKKVSSLFKLRPSTDRAPSLSGSITPLESLSLERTDLVSTAHRFIIESLSDLSTGTIPQSDTCFSSPRVLTDRHLSPSPGHRTCLEASQS